MIGYRREVPAPEWWAGLVSRCKPVSQAELRICLSVVRFHTRRNFRSRVSRPKVSYLPSLIFTLLPNAFAQETGKTVEVFIDV